MIKRVVVAALVLGVSAYAMKGCLSPRSPDKQLAGEFHDVCTIAHDNLESPERGVRQLGRYLVKHLDDMSGQFGALVAQVAAIDDDHKREARALEAHERMRAPLLACQDDLFAFADAIENDPAAKRLHDEGLDRTLHTLMLLLGGEGTKLLPAELQPLLRR
ncbi:MAG: hypothetical protein ABI591_20765 [Kofleriaceae bacterium]